MRLAELSRRSGVSAATIKYYLREGLLPPGERVTATQAEYGAEHLRRLRLVRALVQVGGVPVARAREVLRAVDDAGQDRHGRLGAAVWALPHGPEPEEDDPVTALARERAAELTARLGGSGHGEGQAEGPPHRMLVSALAALLRLGYPCELEQLLPYGELAARLAVHDLDVIERYEPGNAQVEAAVALTVLYEPVLLALRRLAHAAESERRYAAPERRPPAGPVSPAAGEAGR
ncbi:MerR family transcriptional regulator [Streptomyces aidingensis]|uniref:MerR HTH family regulatory protein n=1 Tax=Streptomyces aidingensis TaxID=910347 RepID=A0A1I1NP81_9ACTN|nr:MerR family transcriptional regulator [Streptomyces aidingensis]SFC99494.1 MerR HTH family regulatory protein [Streptomyces aidingensis]